jgi:hypothetical protein
MAKLPALTLKGAAFLTGGRSPVSPRGRIKPPRDPVVLVVLPNGVKLNEPESVIYYALEDLNIRFEAQVLIGQGKALGGGAVDFWLFDYGIDLDFLGPWHFSDVGRTRDFWRDVTRQQNQLRRVFLTEQDLPPHQSIHRRILEIIGVAAVADAVIR